MGTVQQSAPKPNNSPSVSRSARFCSTCYSWRCNGVPWCRFQRSCVRTGTTTFPPHIGGFVHPHVVVRVGPLFVHSVFLTFQRRPAPIRVFKRIINVRRHPIFGQCKFRNETHAIVPVILHETVDDGVASVLPTVFFRVGVAGFPIFGAFSDVLVLTDFNRFNHTSDCSVKTIRGIAANDDFCLPIPASRCTGRFILGLSIL